MAREADPKLAGITLPLLKTETCWYLRKSSNQEANLQGAVLPLQSYTPESPCSHSNLSLLTELSFGHESLENHI